MNKQNWRGAIIAVLCALATTPVVAAETKTPPPDQLRDIVVDQGGRLALHQTDVLVEAHGACRWLDNTSASSEYFVPLATELEWQSFIDHAPDAVMRTHCCPARTVTIESPDITDVQTTNINLPVGRVGAADERGNQNLSHVFTFVRGDGATVTETVSVAYTCAGEEWTAGTPSVVTEVVSPPDPNAPDGCTLIADQPVQNVPVIVSWSGSMRRSSSSNHTANSSGLGGVGDMYMDGNSSRTVINFPLLAPAKDTNVSITATYSAWGPFDGGPRTAQFYIADNQTMLGGTGNTFYAAGRKGDQFSMTNNAIRMPGYDTSPNLLNLTATYNTRVDPNVIVNEGGSCLALGPSGIPTGNPGNYYNLNTGHMQSTYTPGYHCLLQARNWGSRAILPPLDLSAYDLATTKFRVTYEGHLPTGARSTSFVVDPNQSGEVFRDGGNTGKNHMTTIKYDAAAKQFTLENRSYSWGNCKSIDCGGLIMPKLSLQAYSCPANP